jgi:hypothetical protein
MNTHYPTADEPATPKYVLVVLADFYRQQCAFDEDAESGLDISFGTTVKEWQDASSFGNWRRTGRFMNYLFGINCRGDEWKDVLTPAKERTFQDVCGLIARHASRPRITPAVLCDSACLSAGAFLTLRSQLHQAGAKVSDLSPSTLLRKYTRDHFDVFMRLACRLAPGALPLVSTSKQPYLAPLGWKFLLGVGLCLLGWALGLPALMIHGFLLFACAMVLLSALARPTLFPQFGDLVTFRDLAKRIATHLESEASASSVRHAAS